MAHMYLRLYDYAEELEKKSPNCGDTKMNKTMSRGFKTSLYK